MRLLVDLGNTRLKAAMQASDGALARLPPVAWRELATEEVFRKGLAVEGMPDSVLVSNVAGPVRARALDAWCRARWGIPPQWIVVRRECAGMRTRYDDCARLGVDRWVAALAGFRLIGGAVCVIDAGTALTVDVVSAQGEHRGGLIAPGLDLMARSLTEGTAQLTLEAFTHAAGFATRTEAAISLGCQEAIAGLLGRVRERWLRELGSSEPHWLVTGGEAERVRQLSPFPLDLRADLVLHGIALAADAGALQ